MKLIYVTVCLYNISTKTALASIVCTIFKYHCCVLYYLVYLLGYVGETELENMKSNDGKRIKVMSLLCTTYAGRMKVLLHYIGTAPTEYLFVKKKRKEKKKAI